MSLKVIYKFIIVLSIIGLILPSSSFAQVKTPENFGEVKDLLIELVKPIPDGMRRAWEEALVIWWKMADFMYDLWSSKVKPFFQDLWQTILAFFGKEFEKRESIIEKELQKEKEEVKKEIPKVGKNIWERLKAIIR